MTELFSVESFSYQALAAVSAGEEENQVLHFFYLLRKQISYSSVNFLHALKIKNKIKSYISFSDTYVIDELLNEYHYMNGGQFIYN